MIESTTKFWKGLSKVQTLAQSSALEKSIKRVESNAEAFQ